LSRVLVVTAPEKKGNDRLSRKGVSIMRLLIILSRAGNEGMRTEKLLKELGSTHHGQDTIRLTEKQGFIERVKETRRPEGQKGNYAVYNIITPKGKEYLQSLLQDQGKEHE
jgi:DNA-binding PadR family transcriptional regulator